MKTTNKIIVKPYQSACGTLLLGSFEGKLCLCDWVMEKNRGDLDLSLRAEDTGRQAVMQMRAMVNHRLRRMLKADFCEGTDEVIVRAEEQMDEFFGGRRTTFDVGLLLVGTDFQHRVWCELQEIPYGTTISYQELAQRIGMPKAVRAVANAVGANAISIFIPCHRVIGADGSLTGYAGGVDAKFSLLKLENAL